MDTVIFQPPLRDLKGFTVVDPPGSPGGKSAWVASRGVVTQTAMTGAANPFEPFGLPGTNLVGGKAWRDVVVSAALRCDTNRGAVGLLVRWVDEQNHYRFSMSAQGGYRRLVRRVGGMYTVLWEDTGAVRVGQDHRVVVTALGSALSVSVDGVLVCSVVDSALASGEAGFYSWRCPSAVFRGLTVSSRTRRLGDWTIVDGSWSASGGMLSCSAPGALSLGSLQWTDVRVRVLVTASAPVELGVALRWRSARDHYRFTMDGTTRRLLRAAGGVTTELWSAPGPLFVDEWRELVLESIGTRLRVLLDGTVMVDLHDSTHPSGSVAVVGDAGAQFAAFLVSAAAPSWMPYHTFADSALAAGRRVRLFAGTEADLALPPVTSEVRRFQGFAATDPNARRLPPEGVDLRLRTPDGEPIQATRLHPTYTPIPMRILRSADTTGLILLPPNGSPLPPGRYRLTLTYRRDNHTLDPTSPLLRESSDTTPETVSIDIPLSVPPATGGSPRISARGPLQGLYRSKMP